MIQQAVTSGRKKMRDSGIESIKIFAIFIIVISHTTQTLTSVNRFIPYQDYVFPIANATLDLNAIALVLLRHFGAWGNSLFFICSAWFLLKSVHYKKRKWFFMLLEIWTVSIIILAASLCVSHGEISGKLIIKSLFPTIFANNWYMTCYLLFYPIHPILNKIIERMNQTELLRVAGSLVILYIGLDFIGKFFFPSELILWVTIYFAIAYMRFYLTDFVDNIKKNIQFFLLGLIGYIGIVLLTEVLGLHIAFLSHKMLHWIGNCNPFILCMSVTMFNIARNIHFKNKIVNYFSSLSLLTYIIHENIILRTYVRPAIWNYIHDVYGYSHILMWVFVLAICIFVAGTLTAMLYERTLQRFVQKASDALYNSLKRWYLSIEPKLLQIR